MTVTELKELLEGMECEGKGHLKVAVDGYEGGIDDLELENIETIHVDEDANGEWYYGRHEETKRNDAPKRVVLHRRGMI